MKTLIFHIARCVGFLIFIMVFVLLMAHRYDYPSLSTFSYLVENWWVVAWGDFLMVLSAILIGAEDLQEML